MTIWNGTDPLQPDHEVAYRGWPTRQIKILIIESASGGVISYDGDFYMTHRADGNVGSEMGAHFDLIPLQQEQPK